MPGPAPTPTTVLKQRNSLRGRYGREGEPEAEVATPDCPVSLDKEAKREWDRITPLLLKRRTLSKEDMAAVAIYCEVWSSYMKAVRAVTKMEAEIACRNKWKRPPGGVKNHPRAILKEARDALLKSTDRLGLSPAAKARVRAEPERHRQEEAKKRFFPDAEPLKLSKTG